MSYLKELAAHWNRSIDLARLGGANSIQLDAMRSLAESEFGYASNMRLRMDCFWSTKVDKDGDVVLIFSEPWFLGDDGVTKYGERVNVYIDHLGVLTVKNLMTDEVSIYDPNEERSSWEAGSPFVWAFDDRFFKPFTEPSITVEQGQEYESELYLQIAETGECLGPYIGSYKSSDKFELVQAIDYYNGPLEGLARIGGRLHFFTLVYEDEISRDRIFSLRQLTVWQSAKGRLNHLLWNLEVLFNRTLKRQTSPSSWIRLPRFNTSDFVANKISGYTML